MVVTKCKAPEVDIYLKYQGIELSRTFIEKQFAKIIIDPKNYDYDLEFRKGNIYDKFSPSISKNFFTFALISLALSTYP